VNSDFPINDFQEQLEYLLQTEELTFKTIRLKKHQNVYLYGDRAEAIYFIQRGLVKLLVTSPEGNDAIIAICASGQMFGESCLATKIARTETATAMENTVLRWIPSSVFLSHLNQYSLIENFVQYLISRLIAHQQFIARIITLDSEHVLGWTLLSMSQRLGKPDPPNSRVAYRLTHAELSEMVGTTRPRITKFMRKFRQLGLIDLTAERFLLVNETKLLDYLVGLDSSSK